MEKKPQLNDLLMDNESHNLIKKYPDIAKNLRNTMNAKAKELEQNQRGWIEWLYNDKFLKKNKA